MSIGTPHAQDSDEHTPLNEAVERTFSIDPTVEMDSIVFHGDSANRSKMSMSTLELPISDLNECKHPVCFVPGLGGSIILARDNETGDVIQVWPNARSRVNTEKFLFMESTVTGHVEDFNQDYTIYVPKDNFGLTGVDNLWLDPPRWIPQALKKRFGQFEGCTSLLMEQGFVPGETLFGYPWDWRRPVPEVATELHEDIREMVRLAVESGNEPQFCFVSHSLGGIVLQRWLQMFPEDQQHVARIITVACPFRGVPKVLFSPLSGYDLDVSLIFNAQALKQLQSVTFNSLEILPRHELDYRSLFGVARPRLFMKRARGWSVFSSGRERKIYDLEQAESLWMEGPENKNTELRQLIDMTEMRLQEFIVYADQVKQHEEVAERRHRVLSGVQDGTLRCSMCSNPAFIRCCDCDTLLCAPCFGESHRFKCFASHQFQTCADFLQRQEPVQSPWASFFGSSPQPVPEHRLYSFEEVCEYVGVDPVKPVFEDSRIVFDPSSPLFVDTPLTPPPRPPPHAKLLPFHVDTEVADEAEINVSTLFSLVHLPGTRENWLHTRHPGQYKYFEEYYDRLGFDVDLADHISFANIVGDNRKTSWHTIYPRECVRISDAADVKTHKPFFTHVPGDGTVPLFSAIHAPFKSKKPLIVEFDEGLGGVGYVNPDDAQYLQDTVPAGEYRLTDGGEHFELMMAPQTVAITMRLILAPY